ncbi:MAG: hypothetical protein Q9204_007095 [Flavoplaca sp. TL-2023a]
MAVAVAKVVPSLDAHRGNCVAYCNGRNVFAVSSDIVVETTFQDSVLPENQRDEVHSKQPAKNERAIFDILMQRKHWHPNIILGFLHTPEFILVERAHENLIQHVTQNAPISLYGLGDIISDVINAMSWLEQLRIHHGDVRPLNILLERNRNVKLCGFENACSFGDFVRVTNPPYYTRSQDGDFEIAKAGSDQGAIGCCAYFIITGTEPKDRSHDTYSIPFFGPRIRKCWDGHYQSMGDLAKDLHKTLICDRLDVYRADEAAFMSPATYHQRVAECRDFLLRNDIQDNISLILLVKSKVFAAGLPAVHSLLVTFEAPTNSAYEATYPNNVMIISEVEFLPTVTKETAFIQHDRFYIDEIKLTTHMSGQAEKFKAVVNQHYPRGGS